jgi:hypothetical protein
MVIIEHLEMGFGQMLVFLLDVFDVDPQLIFLLDMDSDRRLPGLEEFF